MNTKQTVAAGMLCGWLWSALMAAPPTVNPPMPNNMELNGSAPSPSAVQSRRKGKIKYAIQNGTTREVAGDNGETSGEGIYTVRMGDCLWTISDNELQNAFRWQDVWNINSYINNPDLIYPGNRLRIPGKTGGYQSGNGYSSAGSAPGADNDQQADLSTLARQLGGSARAGTTVAPSSSDGGGENFSSTMELVIEMVKKGSWSGEFLARACFVEFTESNAAEKSTPYAAIASSGANVDGYYKPYDKLEVVLQAISFNVGDMLDVIHTDAPLSIDKKRGFIRHRAARGRVVAVTQTRAAIELLQVWGILAPGDRLVRSIPFATREVDTLLDPERVVTATISAIVGDPASVFLYNQFIIPLSVNDGVALGDIMLGRSAGKEPGKATMIASVIAVQGQTSTLAVLKMFTEKIAVGDTVRTIKRIRFK